VLYYLSNASSPTRGISLDSRLHTSIYPIYFIYLSIYHLSTYLSISISSIYLIYHLSIYLSSFYVSINLSSIYPSIYIYLSIHLYLSVYLSSVYLSIKVRLGLRQEQLQFWGMVQNKNAGLLHEVHWEFQVLVAEP
jgi:hypothetical protein